jgi:hypothetical protein
MLLTYKCVSKKRRSSKTAWKYKGAVRKHISMAEIKGKKHTVEETSSQFEEERLLPPELPFPEVRRFELNLGPTASPT